MNVNLEGVLVLAIMVLLVVYLWQRVRTSAYPSQRARAHVRGVSSEAGVSQWHVRCGLCETPASRPTGLEHALEQMVSVCLPAAAYLDTSTRYRNSAPLRSTMTVLELSFSFPAVRGNAGLFPW